jgi:hypothetical protein
MRQHGDLQQQLKLHVNTFAPNICASEGHNENRFNSTVFK